MLKPLAALLLITTAAACSDGTAGAAGTGDHARSVARTDTIDLEGMKEPVELRLFTSGDDFPLPFTAYVPTSMRPEAHVEDDGAGTVQVVAAFGGHRNPDAFLHAYVFPEGTGREEALSEALGYAASRGIPVSRGLEPLDDESRAVRFPWALEAYTFRYQSEGQWFVGFIGTGEHRGQFFQLVEHYPAEYGDGFPPRAALVLRTWRWADGAPLMAAPSPAP